MLIDVTAVTARIPNRPQYGFDFPEEEESDHDQDSCRRGDHPVFCLTGCRAPGLEQEHRFPAADRLGVSNRFRLRRALGRSSSAFNSLKAFPSRCGRPRDLPDPQFFGQSLPLRVHERFRLCIHHNFVGPGASESFACPLARGVNAHLRSVIRQARSVVE